MPGPLALLLIIAAGMKCSAFLFPADGEPQEQECRVSAAEHTEVEGVQVKDDLVPHQRQEAKEG